MSILVRVLALYGMLSGVRRFRREVSEEGFLGFVPDLFLLGVLAVFCCVIQQISTEVTNMDWKMFAQNYGIQASLGQEKEQRVNGEAVNPTAGVRQANRLEGSRSGVILDYEVLGTIRDKCFNVPTCLALAMAIIVCNMMSASQRGR